MNFSSAFIVAMRSIVCAKTSKNKIVKGRFFKEKFELQYYLSIVEELSQLQFVQLPPLKFDVQ